MNIPNTPESLWRQMAQIQTMERGKVCLLRQGPNGPYYNHQVWENGRNATQYVPSDQVGPLQEAIAGYQQFQQLAEAYVQCLVQKTRAARAAGSKKKTSRPTSSWPKTRKSNR
jgi:hypothetical protein